jgi:hypothetical protein
MCTICLSLQQRQPLETFFPAREISKTNGNGVLWKLNSPPFMLAAYWAEQ